MSTRPSWTAGPANDCIDAYAARSDTDTLPCKHGVYPVLFFHDAATAKVTTVDGTTLTIVMPAGSQYPVRMKQLWDTGSSYTGSSTSKVTGIY